MVIATITISATTITMFEQFVEENHHPLFSFPRMYQAYLDCRRSKRNSRNALAFEIDHETSLVMLVNELREGRYKPGTSICFYTLKPKYREIFAAQFRDRIVHHFVYKKLSPIWERVFIHHSYACRTDKGTHAAATALQKFLRQATHNGTCRAFYLKMDIRNFFMTIDRQLLFQMLISKCPPGDLRELLRVIVFHEPAKDFQLQDRRNIRRMLPKYKSLFFAKSGCGLPIGNLTSQFFANVYLNALDQFVKHQLKARFYIRYMDDLILVHKDHERLRHWQTEITRFLIESLKLSVNNRATRIAPISGGIDFVGFITKPHYRLVRRRVIGNLKIKLLMFESQLVEHRGNTTLYYFHYDVLNRCLATVNSYLGHFRHAKTYSVVQEIFQQFPYLQNYYYLSACKLSRRDRQKYKVRLLKQQVKWLCRKYQNYICIIQIGCYYECFNANAVRLFALTGFALKKQWRGFSYGCGFPKKLLDDVMDELRMLKVPFVIVRQTGRELYRAKERLPYLLVKYNVCEVQLN